MRVDTTDKTGYSIHVRNEVYLTASTSKQLTHDEEITLIRDRENPKSRDRLVLANLGLVHKITGKFPLKNASCSYDDLFQEGIAGLMHGIEKFEPQRGYRLSTYVYRWIQAYITRYYQNHGRTVRVPVHMATKQQQLNKGVETLTRELGRTPTSDEIAELFGDADHVRASMMSTVSLDAPMGDDGDSLEDLQGYDPTAMSDAVLTIELAIEKIRDRVSARDLDIFVRKTGLLGHYEHSLNDLSEMHGITRARVHQIEKQVYRTMRSTILR